MEYIYIYVKDSEIGSDDCLQDQETDDASKVRHRLIYHQVWGSNGGPVLTTSQNIGGGLSIRDAEALDPNLSERIPQNAR